MSGKRCEGRYVGVGVMWRSVGKCVGVWGEERKDME